jgi:hypothetical protein
METDEPEVPHQSEDNSALNPAEKWHYPKEHGGHESEANRSHQHQPRQKR